MKKKSNIFGQESIPLRVKEVYELKRNNLIVLKIYY